MNEGNIPTAPQPDPTEVEYVFTAKFPTHCTAGCNLPISPGQRITKLSTGAYVHEGCA